jgi:hypothetical protein
MATVREYGYYLKGSNIAIVERDTSFDNDPNSKDYGPGSSRAHWKSPLASATDGLEIQYTYSPNYFIDETEDKNTDIDTYVSLDGLLKIIDQGDNNYSTSPESLSDGSYIVLKNSDRWNGLHRVKAAGAGYITLYTKFSGSATVQKSFEKTPELYYNISALVDENSDLDIPSYLAKSVVYFLKAKLAEENGDWDGRRVFMAAFSKAIEKYENKKIAGPRVIAPGAFAIR